MSNRTPRRPDFRVLATTRPGVIPKRAGVIGAGWQNQNGTVSIKLEPFVTISGADDLIITVFPKDREEPTT